MDGYTGGYDEENEPKRRESRRLGRGCVFFSIIRVFIILIYFYNYYSNSDRLSGDYHEENGPKQREARHLGH